MGFVSAAEALAKGPVVRALDEMSLSANARQRLTELRDQIRQCLVYQVDDATGTEDIRRPDFPDLTDVLKNHLLAYWSKMHDNSGQLDQDSLDNMANYLEDNWFGDEPLEYPRFPTRAIYGMGLLKVIDSSLRGRPNPLPIDGYWFIHCDRFELIVLESPRQVTLLIATPAPVGKLYATTDRRAACEAWITCATDGPVAFEVSPPDLDPA